MVGPPLGSAANATSRGRVIDLRSDTVTKPTKPMLAAMMCAEVGDDVWGDDPTINALQDKMAALFGHEAALFCPSGTMTNQIAIKVHTQPGEELICADNAHIYLYEGGGIAFNAGVQPRVLPGDRGRISAAQVAKNINMEDSHFPVTRLVCLENTTNKAGGAYYSLEAMKEMSALCRSRNLKLHLDGARIFNAVVEAGYTPGQVGPLFDSVSVCLSKGLGCPVGSVLIGPRDFIKRAHRVRKVLGGGMRQAGFLAAAGIYALDHHVARLRDDHARARQLGSLLQSLPWVDAVAPVDTNIVIFGVQEEQVDAKALVELLRSHGMLLTTMGVGVLRLVTHLDLSQDDIDAACALLRRVEPTGEKGGVRLGPERLENGNGKAYENGPGKVLGNGIANALENGAAKGVVNGGVIAEATVRSVE